MSTKLSEAEIFSALRAKQNNYAAAVNAFNAINDRLLVYVIRFIKNMTGSETVSEELAVNALSEWFEALDTKEFNNFNEIRKFIFKNALRSIIGYLDELEKTDNTAYQLLYKNKEELHRSIVTYSYDALLMEQLYDKIDDLPAIHKQVFKLVYLKRLSTLEAAGHLNLPEILISEYCRQAIEYLTQCFTHGQLPKGFPDFNSDN